MWEKQDEKVKKNQVIIYFRSSVVSTKWSVKIKWRKRNIKTKSIPIKFNPIERQKNGHFPYVSGNGLQ